MSDSEAVSHRLRRDRTSDSPQGRESPQKSHEYMRLMDATRPRTVQSKLRSAWQHQTIIIRKVSVLHATAALQFFGFHVNDEVQLCI
jgi:hypothetical protein